jgi:hypothetical protein
MRDGRVSNSGTDEGRIAKGFATKKGLNGLHVEVAQTKMPAKELLSAGGKVAVEGVKDAKGRSRKGVGSQVAR